MTPGDTDHSLALSNQYVYLFQELCHCIWIELNDLQETWEALKRLCGALPHCRQEWRHHGYREGIDGWALQINFICYGGKECNVIKSSVLGHNRPIPRFTCPISRNTPFRTEMCTFLFWMAHCGIWDGCIVGFVNFVNWSCSALVQVLTCLSPVWHAITQSKRHRLDT